MTNRDPEAGPPARPHPARSIAVACAAIAIIGATTWYVMKAAEIGPFDRPAIQVPEVSAAVDTSVRSLLFAVDPGGAGPVAVLSAAEVPDRFDAPSINSLMARELARQALLIAARDELGMGTRDGTLGEAPDPARAPAPADGIELHSRFSKFGPHLVSLRRGDELLVEHQFTVPTAWTVDGASVAGEMARLSRSAFPDALRRAGLGGEPVARVAGAPVPDGVEDRLGRLSAIDQFAAVRALHGAIRGDGASADRLGALVRGYAHLGLMTEDLWTPAHKAYKARALLYADRLVADESGSAGSLWHRAYARALAGLHRDALADLEAASGAPGAGAPPDWVNLVDAYCRFDVPRLDEVDDGDRLGPLARLLAFHALECSTTRNWGTGLRISGEDLLLEASREALDRFPECGRIHRASCRYGGISHLHEATLAGPRAYSETLPGLLRGLPGLPSEAAGLIDDPANEPELMRVLVAGGVPGRDRGELSWSALGSMLREARFVQVFDRLSFMTDRWNVPAGPEAVAWRPLVADHPYRGVIEAVIVGRGTPQALGLLRGAPLRDLELSASQLFDSADVADPAWGDELHRSAFGRTDWNAWDLAQLLQEVASEGLAETANDLLVMSPYSPMALAVLIDSGFGPVVDRVDELERSFGYHPGLLESIGRRYAAEGRLDDADRVLSRCLERSGDRKTYETMAGIQLARGDADAWRRTLDRFLEEEDHGLDHATVRVNIANMLMSQGDYEAALPYAELAARSWAEWAMRCAISCYEGLGDLDRAELWVRRLSERYPTSWSEWFLWCKQTGRGDVDAARELADRVVDAQPDRFLAGQYHALAGRPDRALEELRAAFEADRSPMNAGGLILMADALGEVELRNSTLSALCDEESLSGSGIAQISRPMRDALFADPPGPIDVAAIDATLEEVLERLPGGRGSYEYFVGQLLRRHGHPLEGLNYLRRCVESDGTYPIWRVMAICELRDAGAADPAVASAGPAGAAGR